MQNNEQNNSESKINSKIENKIENEIEDKNDRFIEMTTEPVEKLVVKYAMPAIFTMLVTSIYNIVDTMYVGRISTEATAAVGIVFTYSAIIQAMAFFFGQGSANYISRAIGAKDEGNAENMAAVGFFSAVIVGVILMAIGLIFTEPILRLLGSTETIMGEAKSYFRVLLIGTPYCMATFVLNIQMRLQGNAKLGMRGMVAGAVLNMILDPIFIFVFDFGVAGAALATIIAQLVSFIILLNLSTKRGGIKVQLKNFKPTVESYIEITSAGLPSLLRQGLASIAGVFLFQYAGAYGDSAIAAISIVNKVSMFVMSIMVGFGQGFQPVSGVNYGAKLYNRVEKAFWFGVKVSTIFGFIMSIVCFTYASEIIMMFRGEDPELVKVGIRGIRSFAIVYPLLGFSTMTQMYLQNIRKTVSASILSMSRQGICYLPTLFICATYFGLNGLLVAQPLADLFTFFLSLFLGFKALNEMKKM